MSSLPAQIEGLLFSEGGSLTKRKLAHILSVGEEEIEQALKELREQLSGRGLSLVVSDTEASLVVSKDVSRTVQEAFERELGKEIGDAGLEVLSILLYRGPSTRAQIDYIRGVNTSSTLRLLSARGLVERAQNPDDAREYLYRPTVEALSYLGVARKEDLPDYDTISRALTAFEESQTQNDIFDEHAQR